MSSEYEPLLGQLALPPPEKVTIPAHGLPDPLLIIGAKREAQKHGGDNMVKRGGKKLEAGASKKADGDKNVAEKDRIIRFCILVFLPTTIFAMTLLAIYKIWIYWPLLLFWYVLLSLILLVFLYRQAWLRKEWQHVALQFMIGALVLSLFLGMIIFYQQWIYFFRYRDLRQHTNVAGSQTAEAFADAGMLRFTKDTTVDSDKAVGYLSARVGKRLCVAPVVDATAQPSEPVSFFAIGVDCCAWRGTFACDDAGDPEARGAMLQLDPATLTGSPLLEWMVDDWALREDFYDALKLEKSAFGTLVAPTVRFLAWVKDPVEHMNNYWRTGFWQAFSATAIYGGVLTYYVLVDTGGTTRPMSAALAAASGPAATA